MSSMRQIPWYSFGLVALFLGLLGGLVFLTQPVSQAHAGQSLTNKIVAFLDKNQLVFLLPISANQNEKGQREFNIKLLADGKTLANQTESLNRSATSSIHRLSFPLPSPSLDNITVRCSLDNETTEVPLRKILVLKPHETNLTTSQEFYPGSKSGFRCLVQTVRTLMDAVPLPESRVLVTLEGQGKKIKLLDGQTDQEGLVRAELPIPVVPSGDYKLEVVTQSRLGEEKLERSIKIKSTPRILLTSDKPLYQPGQTMHLRALALQTHDLRPVTSGALTFEVEDPRGNKVFKRQTETSGYGISSIDFTLASEVNQGDYQVRANLGDVIVSRTVTVKPYVLPKFKSELKADKRFYLPRETISADLQVDYLFGKPVALGKVKVIASTFDVAFKEFQTWEGKTDANGHVHLDVKLPDYFVGQPLDKGNAIVRLEIQVTDTADHTEVIQKTFPVSNQPLQLSLIPEGGRIIPGMDNRIFAAAIYPDGSPARAEVHLWMGKKGEGKPVATVTTSEAGLAEFHIRPRNEDFRPGEVVQQTIEMRGGNQIQTWMPKNLLDMTVQAADSKGSKACTSVSLTSETMGDNVSLQLSKAIYKAGERVDLTIRSSAGLPTVYLDVIRSGQVLLTQWIDVKEGKGSLQLDLPPGIFGTLEIHAYQMLASGEMIRDSRVVYVNPVDDLKIKVLADETVYLPGQKALVKFEVTDQHGKPAPAALGVLVVDEAVFALQDMQPGLEKVYFTLQEELLKPQAQILYKPREGLDDLVRQPQLLVHQQQVAEVLLTGIRPKTPAHWDVNPAAERIQQLNQLKSLVGQTLYQYSLQNKDLIVPGANKGEWTFDRAVFNKAIRMFGLDEATLGTLFAGSIDAGGLARLEPGMTAQHLAEAITRDRIVSLTTLINQEVQANKPRWFQDGKLLVDSDAILEHIYKRYQFPPVQQRKDAWNQTMEIRPIAPDARPTLTIGERFELISAGADGKFGTSDDVRGTQANSIGMWTWWMNPFSAQKFNLSMGMGGRAIAWGGRNRGGMMLPMAKDGMPGGFGGGGFGGPGQAGMAVPMAAARSANGVFLEELKEGKNDKAGAKGQPPGSSTSPGAAPTRTREYFPETLLWQSALITDDQGRADLPFTMADSITTWRLNASASSKNGLLGSVSAPLRVFQDFFVDIDLPVALTRNDEVSFPVAVYNYLKTPQTVKLELEANPAFDLMDGKGLIRNLDLQPNQVLSVQYRIRATRLGGLPLTVKATGSKQSDAVKRVIDVVPDGKRMEKVVSDRLSGQIQQTIQFPETALPDASKILVKIYPGVFAQVLEGVDGMLRMPGGCFEQTSSSAYPNILVVDYLKRNRIASPALLMKAENYLNAGYQRLLTFERPGGGFDWWGSGEPLVWLSAYGLQEFNDMSRVYPIDRGIIERTQKWLLSQRAADGTWSKIGATHSESIERMGDPKLLLTSYVVWALLDSGIKSADLDKSIAFIRQEAPKAENPYILALAANALASWDAKDDGTFEVVQKLLTRLNQTRKELPEMRAICFPAGGQSLSYARGDSLTVETTALAALAMIKNGQFPNDVNKALVYLIKSKDASGTWGSTQATILALKALVRAASAPVQKERIDFTIRVDGKKAGQGFIDSTNSDVLQLFDLGEQSQLTGKHEISLEVKGETSLLYQIVARHYEPWTLHPPEKSQFEVAVDYDRTKLTTADLLRAKATLKYIGKEPTSMVMLDLGIPPGFTVDGGEFAEMVAQKKINKFSLTQRQIILYLGDVTPGQVQTFEYALKPKYPIRARTPASVAYEYYTPANRFEAKPTELLVEEKK